VKTALIYLNIVVHYLLL